MAWRTSLKVLTPCPAAPCCKLFFKKKKKTNRFGYRMRIRRYTYVRKPACHKRYHHQLCIWDSDACSTNANRIDALANRKKSAAEVAEASDSTNENLPKCADDASTVGEQHPPVMKRQASNGDLLGSGVLRRKRAEALAAWAAMPCCIIIRRGK
jgi:hypothetical protein